MSEKFILGVVDCAIIGIILTISAGIGLYFRIFGGQQTTNEVYLFAGKNVSVFPVAFSLMAAFMAAPALMGIPAEMYLYGTHMAFMNIGFLLGPIISSYVFMPIYFDNNISTVYEYLERRFGKTIRRILCVISLIQCNLFNAIVLYAPALALSAVTNLSLWTSVISIGVVCTFYCTLGGMKAVLWASVFQSTLMYICLISIVVKGWLDLGGPGNILSTAYDGGRMIIPTFDLDFSTRYTMYSVFLQGLIMATARYGNCQPHVQIQLTMKNVKYSTIAAAISAPMLVVFQLLCCLCGLIFYVYYKECDPMTYPTKPISSADQLMPLYITSTLGQFPGLAGLRIAGIFSASFSTLSSNINSMAAVTYEDIIKSIWPNKSSSVFILKIASLFYGVLMILLTFVVASMGNLNKATLLALGMITGQGLGVFLLAAFTTTTTEMGANVGVVLSFLVAGYMAFVPNNLYYPELEIGKNCSIRVEDVFNTSFSNDLGGYANISSLPPASAMSTMHINSEYNFPVSFMWITPLSLVVCMVVGYFTSWIVSCFTEKSEEVPDVLLCPLRRRFLSKTLPNKKEKAAKYEESSRL